MIVEKEMPPSTRNMEKEAAEEAQAKVTSNNARIVKMNQVKTKMSRLQTKLECAMRQLKGSFIDYTDIKDDKKGQRKEIQG